MKMVLICTCVGLVTLVALLLISIWISSGNKPAGGTKIAKKGFVEIGGVPQGYFIRGESERNPVILFLHGGPGSPEISIIDNTKIEHDFTVCYWEQRGAGISYSSDLDPQTMTIEQLVEDTRQMADTLQKWYGVDKIYLVGHSWGSFLGVKTVEKYPELFHAYIGIGQVTNQHKSEVLAYEYIVEEAQKCDDKRTLKTFEKFDKNAPDFPSTKYLFSARMPAMNKYGIGMQHENASLMKTLAQIFYYGGYTFGDKLNYLRGMGFSQKHLWHYVTDDNLFESSPSFEIPVYIVQGKWDYQVSHQLAKEYFDVITAPKKEFFTFENSAHSPNIEDSDRFAQVLRRIKNDIENQKLF